MLEMARWMNAKGWFVCIKSPPPDMGHIIQGARSEYDAPCEDQTVAVGRCCVEVFGADTFWTQCEFADTAPLAVAQALLAAVEQEKNHGED
jgi:hypothetical protein